MNMEIAREGQPTIDGRYIRPGGLTWTEPLPLRDAEGYVIGVITDIHRQDGDDAHIRIMGSVQLAEGRTDPVKAVAISVDSIEVWEGKYYMTVGKARLCDAVLTNDYPWVK